MYGYLRSLNLHRLTMINPDPTGINEQPPEEHQYREQSTKKEPGAPIRILLPIIGTRLFGARYILENVCHSLKDPVETVLLE